jgi:hypothetical protein
MNMRIDWIKSVEALRIILVFAGFYCAYSAQTSALAIDALILWVVLPLTGLTAMESFLFAKESAAAKGRSHDRSYQMQSATNHLATALTAIVVSIYSFGISAKIAVILVALFLFLGSGILHVFEYFFYQRPVIHLQIILVSVLLWVATLSLIWPVFPW